MIEAFPTREASTQESQADGPALDPIVMAVNLEHFNEIVEDQFPGEIIEDLLEEWAVDALQSGGTVYLR